MPPSKARAAAPILVRAVALDPYRRHFGADPGFAALLERHGLPTGRQIDPYEIIPLQSLLELQERAAEYAGDPMLGARIGSRNTPADLGPAGLLLLQSSTLRRGLGRFAASVSALQGSTIMRLVPDGYLLAFSYQLRDYDLSLWPQDAELSLASTCNLIRSCFDPRWAPLEVQFAHRPPARPDLLEQIFQAPVRFGQSANRILLSTDRVDIPQRSEDRALITMIEHYIVDLSLGTTGGGPFREEVEAVVARLIGQRRCTLDCVAAEFGMTPRALQRRLATEGTTLRALQREQRMRIAERHIHAPDLQLSEVAQALGYSDGTVFWRAYRRWTGEAPSAQRRRRATGE